MHRYLAIVWDPFNLDSARTLQSLGLTSSSTSSEWTIASESPGSLVMHAGSRQSATRAYPLHDNSGVVLGRIFDRQHGEYTATPRMAFDAGETRKIVASAGQHLIDRYWGAYFAVVFDASATKHHVFRDPTGNMPCYQTTLNGVEIFFSDIEDCVRLLPISFSVNRAYLTRWLISSALKGRATGLENVENVVPGERLTLSQGRVTRSIVWDPIAMASAPRFEALGETEKAVRATVQSTVDAWASCYSNITHKLSGGLDSSIVAGCLAHAPSKPRISFLNLSPDSELEGQHLHLPGIDRRLADKLHSIAGSGDERHFARLVAERWKTALFERQRAASMDMTRLWHAPLRTSPALYYTSMQSDDIELQVARELGTQAFFSGQAGDSVFLATQQPLPAMDYAHVRGLESGLWEQLFATSKLSKASLWSVMGKTLRHGFLHGRYTSPVAVLDHATLVRSDLVHALTNEDFQSELTRRLSRSSLPPGKRNHANGLAGAAYYDFTFYSDQYADHINPLNSQPVWEMMLQIPTWTVLAGGVSRGLARRAFADLLPAEIRKRQVKGSGGPLYQHFVRRNRAWLRSTLLDGLLVQQGYLDRRRLEECLRAEEPSLMVSAVFMLNYLSAEVWLQRWTESRQEVSRHSLAAFKWLSNQSM